jgi:hypothetical protein
MDPVVGQLVLTALLVFIPIVGFSYLISHQNKQKHRARWEKLAAANNLVCVSNASRQSYPHIAGEYRGHHLALRVIEKSDRYNHSVTYTRLVLTPKKQETLPALDPSEQRSTLEQAVKPFITTDPQHPLRGKVYATLGGRQVYYEQYGIETNIARLQYLFDLLTDLSNAYPQILTIGSQAVPFLQKNAKLAIVKGKNSLRPITLQLLEELTQASRQWGYQISHKLCPQCLARCVAHEVSLSALNSATYYGCRICRQSEEFLDWAGPIVAILDSQSAAETSEEKGALRVNWLVRRALFDFETIEIVQAIDEDVERFAVQVGNDTDELRQSQYENMHCTVSSACQLSENTIRILRHTFGEVDVK